MKCSNRLAVVTAALTTATLMVASASAQTASTLLYSFETLDGSNLPDSFHANGGGTTVTQNTIGATNGTHSLKFTMVTNATFSGAQTTLLPAELNGATTTAIALDLTINPGDEFAGGFADMGLTEFGLSNDGNSTPEQSQSTLSFQHSVSLPAGTYRIVLPAILPFNPFDPTFTDDGPNHTGLLIPPFYGAGPSQITPTSWEFYLNKGLTSGPNPKPNAAITFYVDNVRAIASSIWGVDGDGDWNTAGNWFGGAPNAIDAEADLLSVINSNHTLTNNAAVTLGRLDFNQATTTTAGYTIAGTGSIKMQASTGGATVQVDAGTQQVNVPIEYASNSTITSFTAGCTLTFGAPVTVDNGISVAPSGPGTILYTSTIDVKPTGSITFGNSLHPTGLTLEANSNAKLTAHTTGNPILVVQLDNFTAATGAKFDLTNNEMLVSQNLATVRGELQAGKMVTTTAGRKLAYVDHGGGLTEVIGTLAGDTNIDATVDVGDLGALATSYGATSGAVWAQGDFDYNGTVDVGDLGALATNYGQSIAGGFEASAVAAPSVSASVPEPASLAGCIVVLALLGQRRRRRE